MRHKLRSKRVITRGRSPSARPALRLRACALSIRAVHRLDFDTTRERIAEAAALLQRAADATNDHPDVRYTGFLLDAQKDFAEANLTLAFVEGREMPTADELGVETAAYLNGTLSMLDSGFAPARGESYTALAQAIAALDGSIFVAQLNIKTVRQRIAKLNDPALEADWMTRMIRDLRQLREEWRELRVREHLARKASDGEILGAPVGGGRLRRKVRT